MKTKILLFTAVFLLNLLSFGQSEQIIDSFEYEFLHNPIEEFENPLFENDEQLDLFIDQVINNHGPDDLWMLDSIVSYDFISEIDSFSFERKIYTYNTTNNTVEYIIMQRLIQEEEWQNITRSLLTFNENGEQVLSISFIWDEDQWLEERRIESAYDENNSEIRRTILVWEQNQWINYSKIEHNYNINNEPIEQSNYDWILEDETWFHTFKVEFDYNDQGLMDFVLLYSLNYETNELYAREKQETIFNDLGLLIEKVKHTWDLDLAVWVPFNKLISSYNDGLRSNDNYWWRETGWQLNRQYEETRIDSLTLASNTYSLIDDSLWLHTRKSEFSFDGGGRLTSQESYNFIEYMSYWIGELKFEWLNNDNGQTFARIYYDWDVVLDKWDYDTKEESGYDENQIRNYTSTKQWNLDESIWETVDSQRYYYTNISSINENKNEYSIVNVYPNPCSKQLNLDIRNSNNSETIFRIYSILGETVIEGSLSKTNMNINVSQLEKGFYMIQAVNGKNKYSGKFLKF